MRGVFYRSDTRHPTDEDAIFTNGFSKREARFPKRKFRFPMGRRHAPDIVPASAVCITRHFEAAPLFPVNDLDTDAWVYVMDLDVSGIANTQQCQFTYVTKAVVGRANVAEALWPMFGQERAANRVEPGDIVGAVFVERRFYADNVLEGGEFYPVEYRPNPGYTGPAGTAELAESLILPLVDANAWIKMPTQTQGIVKIARN